MENGKGRLDAPKIISDINSDAPAYFFDPTSITGLNILSLDTRAPFQIIDHITSEVYHFPLFTMSHLLTAIASQSEVSSLKTNILFFMRFTINVILDSF